MKNLEARFWAKVEPEVQTINVTRTEDGLEGVIQ